MEKKKQYAAPPIEDYHVEAEGEKAASGPSGGRMGTPGFGGPSGRGQSSPGVSGFVENVFGK